jgi:hypothetical protein
MTKCEKQGEHRYEKFDDRSIFCERCGDQKFLVESPPFVYPVYPTWRPIWYYQPTITNPYYFGTISTGTVMTGNTATYDINNDQFTFTSLADGNGDA